MKSYNANNIREATLFFNKEYHTYEYLDKSQDGTHPFERCIEVPWVEDKVSQIIDVKGCKLFDFGCNKAKYILKLKKEYDLMTSGIDMKEAASKYVDTLFFGMYNDKLKNSISQHGPYKIVTAISAIEHAGSQWHPNNKKIKSYQLDICNFLMKQSQYFFISVPFGLRPGWAIDKSRTNLYQFNIKMLDTIADIAKKNSKKYFEEIYIFDNGYWVMSDRNAAKNSRYRERKQGASSIALISIWR